MFINTEVKDDFIMLYLPTIHNACSSKDRIALMGKKLYLPTIHNACSSSDKYYSV